ncbi:futalosine hydrolase [Rugosimonospora africana]|uniref:Futalosine hydrolase n=1 Tax=Rugosimonospora africana TaxID=556532 RepID=A0A8J3QWW7_9ACTN|nr:futalosine hydrolase [Rugosimonospora africana]GIH17597.1 Futalosine hydrolase [Rugosimonospora africana]
MPAGAGRLLVVTAVDAERDAVVAGAGELVDVAVIGVGPASAAAATARLLATTDTRYRAVISAGIGGGFSEHVGVGGLALATRSIAADLGAESPERFLPLDELGFGTVRYEADADLMRRLTDALPDAAAGTVLTVSTTTGTAAGTAALRDRYPDAVAEGMEGFGVATAAAQAGVPFGELRAISNAVGPRDRAGWRIGDALAALTRASAALGKLEA